MNHQLLQDIQTIENKLKSLHQSYLDLKALESTHAQNLSAYKEKIDKDFQAAQLNIQNMQRVFQNSIEANKDFLAELTEMISQLPPKFAKDYTPGYAVCPSSVDMNRIRSFYEMVIEDTVESFNNRLFKRNGYYDWKQMTLDFMRMVEEAELCLQKDIQQLINELNRNTQKAQQTTNYEKQQNISAYHKLEQDQKQELALKLQKLQQERQAFLSSELVVGFDSRIASLSVDTGATEKDWLSYNAQRSMAPAIAFGNISCEIQAESVSLTSALKKSIKCFHPLQGDSAKSKVNYGVEYALPCNNDKERQSRSQEQKAWRAAGVQSTKQNDTKPKAEFFVPYTLSSFENFRLYYAYGAQQDSLVAGEIQSIILKKLRSYPTDSIHTYFIDPVSRGSNLGVLNASKNENDEIGILLYNSKDDIRDALTAIEKHIDETVSRLGKFSSVKEFNRNSKAPITESLLVIFNFPENFTQDTLETLNTIIKNSDKCGIDIIISSEYPAHYLSIADNASRFDWSAFIKEKWTYITRMGNHFMLSEDGHNYCNYKLCEPPVAQRSFVQQYRKAYADSMKIDNKFSNIFNSTSQSEYKDATNGIALPVMIRNQKKGEICDFVIGTSSSTHTLITGSTSSGKSTFLHMIITSIIMNYHPDDVELWLIDYGRVEFKKYLEKTPPHMRFISLEKGEEFTYSFLSYLKDFFTKREKEFLNANVSDIKEYRKKFGKLSMPRVVVIVDEFHNMTQHVQQNYECRIMLENALAEYRKFGLSCIFSNQTITGLIGLTDTAKLQIKNRIALANEINEMKLTLAVSNDNYSKDNMIMRMERTSVGELWYKEWTSTSDFSIEQFKGIYINSEERDRVLDIITHKCSAPAIDKNIIKINSSERTHFPSIDIQEHIEKTGSNTTVNLYLGSPVTIEKLFYFALEDKYKQNILMIGRETHESVDLMKDIIVNMISSASIKSNVDFIVYADPRNDLFNALSSQNLLRSKTCSVKIYTDISEICYSIYELSKNIDSRTYAQHQTIILWLGLPDIYSEFEVSQNKGSVKWPTPVSDHNTLKIDDRDIRKLVNDEVMQKNANDLGISVEDFLIMISGERNSVSAIKERADFSYNAIEDMISIFAKGGKFGIHSFVALPNASEIRNMKPMDKDSFIHKILLSVPKDDYYELGIRNNNIELEEGQSALYTDGLLNKKFKPFYI